jgi:LysM repeat protein
MVPGLAGRWSQTTANRTGPSSITTSAGQPTAIIEPMTERGLPVVDGAPACPFVAFEDDRDARAASPDHRHRCYAEVRPAPRALAHQEAYCLSSAFPVCPTFQDWARREAAQARGGSTTSRAGASAAPGAAAAGAAAAAAATAAAEPTFDAAPDATGEAGSQRNPPRAWSAPPPWSGDPRTPGGAGLSGSMADRLAAGEPIAEAEAAEALAAGAGAAAVPAAMAEPRPRPARPAVAALDAKEGSGRPVPQMARPPDSARRPVMPIDPDAPSWERPRRMEAYPSLRARVGLPTINPPPMLLGIVAVALAAVALFFLPSLIGLGGPDATGTPNPSSLASAGPSASVEPTSTPAPTQQIYIVQSGDTLSGIAQRFGTTLEALRAANPQITNVDEIKIGDEIIIPATIPTQIPDAGSPSPAASTAP